MNRKIIIIEMMALFLIVGFFFIPLPSGLTGYSTVRGAPFLKVDVSSIESHYERFPDCYSVIEGIVVNRGSFDADDVSINCSVLDENGKELGMSIDKIKLLKARDSISFRTTVNLKCIPAAAGQKYRCDVGCASCNA